MKNNLINIILNQEKDLNSYLYRELNIFSGGADINKNPTTLKCLFCQEDIDIGNMEEAVIYVCSCGGVVIWGENNKKEEIKQKIENYFLLINKDNLNTNNKPKQNLNVSQIEIKDKISNKIKTILFVKYNNNK